MIVISSALMLIAAAPPADPVKDAGRAYRACINDHIKANLEKKTEPDAFDGSLAGACTPAETRFRTAVINQQLAAKARRPEAEDVASGWAEDYQTNAKEMYREYLSSNTRPD